MKIPKEEDLYYEIWKIISVSKHKHLWNVGSVKFNTWKKVKIYKFKNTDTIFYRDCIIIPSVILWNCIFIIISKVVYLMLTHYWTLPFYYFQR